MIHIFLDVRLRQKIQKSVGVIAAHVTAFCFETRAVFVLQLTSGPISGAENRGGTEPCQSWAVAG